MDYKEALDIASKNDPAAFMPSLPYQVAGSAAPIYYAYQRGFDGAFLAGSDKEWQRVIALHDENKLKSLAKEVGYGGPTEGEWRGQRATRWIAYLETNPGNGLKGSQDTGNCTAWSLRECLNCLLCSDIERGQPQKYPGHRIGTAVTYAARGHSGAGMTLSAAVQSALQRGVNVEKVYKNGKTYDLSTESFDEAAGVSWWSGVPSQVLEAIKEDVLKSYIRTTNVDIILNAMTSGAFGFHGSQLTARPSGKLVSELQSIGAHAQAFIGFDDTEEFKIWYENKYGTRPEAVVIHDQSWGNWNPLSTDHWPPFWPEKPEGAWVVTLTDFKRIIGQWNDVYLFTDMGGYPDDGPPPPPPPPGKIVARARWKKSPTPDVFRYVITFSKGNDVRKLTVTPDVLTVTSANAGLSLQSGDEISIVVQSAMESGKHSLPVEWRGEVPDFDEPPEPPTELTVEFTKS